MPQKPKIIFFSSSDFGLPALRLLVKEGLAPILCVTKPDRLIGRHSKLAENIIAQEASQFSIPTIKPKTLKDESVLEHMRQLKPDLGILVSYGKILPDALLKIPAHGIINIHPSLLPLYRGPSPIQTALLNGDTKTGTTIMLLDQEVDHGPIIAQEEYVIPEKATSQSLFEALGAQGAQMLVNCLSDFIEGKLQPQSQDHSKATYTKMIFREDGRLNSRMSVKEAWSRFRAFKDEPGCFIELNDDKSTTLKILDCIPSPTKTSPTDKQMYVQNKRLFLSLSDGNLELIRVQKTGGKAIPALDFINGNLDTLSLRTAEK